MGSINHPRVYDDAAMANMKAAFHDVWDAVEARSLIWDTVSEDELKAAIIRKLLDLAAKGTTNRDILKVKILRGLKTGGHYEFVRTPRFRSARS